MLKKKVFPVNYKKDIVINEKWSFEKFYNFINQYKNIKLSPDEIVTEYENLIHKKVAKKQLNKLIIKN